MTILMFDLCIDADDISSNWRLFESLKVGSQMASRDFDFLSYQIFAFKYVKKLYTDADTSHIRILQVIFMINMGMYNLCGQWHDLQSSRSGCISLSRLQRMASKLVFVFFGCYFGYVN